MDSRFTYPAAVPIIGPPVRPLALELGLKRNGAYSPIMTHLCKLPQSYRVNELYGDSLQLLFPGGHNVHRAGWVGCQVTIAGHTGGAFARAIVNNAEVSGESVFRGMQALFDCWSGKGKFAVPGRYGYSRLPDGSEVLLQELSLRWYCFDAPDSQEHPAEGIYEIQPQSQGGFVWQREAKRAMYHYSLSFTCLDLAAITQAEAAAFYNAAFALDYSLTLFRAESVVLSLAYLALHAADVARNLANYRDEAATAMAAKPWESSLPTNVPADLPQQAMSAYDDWMAGL